MRLEQKVTPATVRDSKYTNVLTPRYCHGRVSTGVFVSTVPVEEFTYNTTQIQAVGYGRKEMNAKTKYRGFPRVMILPAVGSKGFRILVGWFWLHFKMQPVGSGPVEKFIYLASRVVSGRKTLTSSGSDRVMSREIRVAHGSYQHDPRLSFQVICVSNTLIWPAE